MEGDRIVAGSADAIILDWAALVVRGRPMALAAGRLRRTVGCRGWNGMAVGAIAGL